MAGRTTLTALGVALGVAALLAAAAIWLATRSGPARAGLEHALVGDALLAYPAAYARTPLAAPAGRVERLDLAAAFPDFQPAGEAKGATTQAELAARAERLVFLALTADDKSLEPAERPAKLYAPFLEPIGYARPGGLVMRRFQQGSPYEGETLMMTPPEGRAFWARCPAQAEGGAQGLREPCFTEMRLDGLNLTLRFSPALLPDWERLRDGARALVEGFRKRA
mgnify:CR=1 FL=1